MSSTVKANNFQIGQSLTATQNATWYQPSTPDGTVRLGIGNAGATTSDVLVANSSGNIGIGTSSPTLYSGYKTLAIVGGVSGGVLDINPSGGVTGGGLQIAATPSSTVFGAYGPSGGSAASMVFSVGTYGSVLERMRLDSSGNLGLGVTPSGWSLIKSFQIAGGVSLGGYNNNLYLNANAYYDGSWKYVANGYATRIQSDTGSFSWFTAPSGTAGNAISFTQAMTLDASGNWSVGHTGIGLVNANSIQYSVSNAQGYMTHINGTSSGQAYWIFGYNGSTIGTIVQNGTTGVTYNTTSDQRLKENIVDAPGALSSINAIKVRSFDWKSDGSHVDYGYIAQELLEVVPEAVSVPADSDEMMGVDFGKLTPRLVKAIQELSAQVTTLQAEINALKA